MTVASCKVRKNILSTSNVTTFPFVFALHKLFLPVDTDKINKKKFKFKLNSGNVAKRKIIIDENTSSESCKYYFYVNIINDER